MGKLQNFFFAVSNPKRRQIYEMCLKNKLNITQIKDKIGLNYTSVLNNLKILEEAELIKKEKEKTEKSQETFIISIPLKEGNVYFDVYKRIKAEEKEN